MKLSVVIPVYRTEATLNRCVESVVGQTYRDLEVILVDDGSPDLCPQLCDDWVRRDGRISVIHKANGGLSDARNAGIDRASGALITFVDSDDYLQADTYEHVVPLLAQADMAEYSYLWQQGSPKEQLRTLPDATFSSMADYWLHAHVYEHTYAWNKVFRRELFREVRFPKERVFEDAWTLPLLLKNARRIATCSKGLYCYTANAQGITATAGGAELSSLLAAHVATLQDPLLANDARYYMHVLNIQLDVCRLTASEPLLPARRVSPASKGLSASLRLKALLLNLFGIEGLCKINQTIRKMGRRP